MTEQKNSSYGVFEKLGLGLLLCTVAGVFAFVVWGIWRAAFPPLPPFQGQMEARVINISSKVPGRVKKILVEAGENVKEGQIVARMHLPDIEARLAQARAQDQAAAAQQSMVDEGLRPQEKKVAQAEWERALAGVNLALKTYDRIAALFKDGLVSRERYDEAHAKMLATSDQAQVAKQVYDLALLGSREQQKTVASAETSEAEAGVSAAFIGG